MSKIEKTICDNCGKEVRDHHAEYGWIRIDGGTVTVTEGREHGMSGNAKSRVYISSSNSQPLDLCSAKCLVEKLKLETAKPRVNKTIEPKLPRPERRS